MADSKLAVDFHSQAVREAALASAFASAAERFSTEAKVQSGSECAGCGAHTESLQSRAVWQQSGQQAVLHSMEGYCPDCIQVLDLKSEDLQSPQKAMAAVSWLAAVNNWSFVQTTNYLQEQFQSMAVELTYDTQAFRASLGPEIDLFEEPALDAAENWAASGGHEAVSIEANVEEEIGEVDVLAAVDEAQAESSAPSIITYVPDTNIPPTRPVATPSPVIAAVTPPQVEPEQRAAPTASPAPAASSAPVAQAKVTNQQLRAKMEATARDAAANYYASMTRTLREKHQPDLALAAWNEAHYSTNVIQHILWTRYHDLLLKSSWGSRQSRSKVRILKEANQPNLAVIELGDERWRLRVLNNYPGHSNQWILSFQQRQGQDWNGISFQSENALMEYFAQHVAEKLAESPRVEMQGPAVEQVQETAERTMV